MMICWLPDVDSDVTDCPEPADWVIAAVPPAVAPAGTTNTAKAAPEFGGGAQLYAHPIFHVPPPMVNEGLVQSPVIWVAGTSTWAVPVTVVVVDVELAAAPAATEVAAVVEVVALAELLPKVVVLTPPDGGGRLEPDDDAEELGSLVE
jgi:hypothetical protein